jgi:hypothetical protein
MHPNTRWHRVRELFELALEHEPPELDAWLDQQQVPDESLRDEVRSLVAHHTRAGSFLVAAVADVHADLLIGEDLAPGAVVGPYTIDRELGRGGMGRVYLATDHRLGRRIALKALSPALTADPSHRDRLRHEARAAGALTHPGICTIYALEEVDGNLFIAAEFIDGHTLREEIDRTTRPTPSAVLGTVRELASALASAHGRGITHRDLKPENVMRTTDGRLKILDFGLASIDLTGPAPLAPGAGGVETEYRLTQPGAVLGTPAYMAPEQLHGQPADARADVFALGILLYEYACGTHPFSAATPLAVMARILEGEAVAVERWRTDLPSAFGDVVRRCLRKSPADRFVSAADILPALDRPVTAPQPSSRLTAWWRTHQLAVMALYLVACGLTWQIKEWRPGMTATLFAVAVVGATVGGILRGHLLFTERVTTAGLTAERTRTMPMTLASDLLIAAVLLTDGLLLAPGRPLAGVLTMALGVGVALARLVVEPATTAATFTRALRD